MADLTGANAQLLDQNLATSAPWSILVHHKPMFSASAGAHPGDVITMRNAWQPIIDSHKVDLVLNGHDHDYERSKPMRGMTPGVTNADGTVFVVVGSAGAPLYDKGSDFWTAYSEKTYCFAIVRVKKGLITFNAYHADGTPIDSTMLTK
jgi:3',5'-cyclic AMP phosphodiesterase CpdA